MTTLPGAAAIGFIGTGTMGAAMAARLIAAGANPLLWNRSRNKLRPLRAIGGRTASTPEALFSESEIIIVMLADDDSTDDVLSLAVSNGGRQLSRKLVVNMGTGSPDRALAREAAIAAMGGTYVEAPVSGSRGPAEQGELIAMVAGGRPDQREAVCKLIEPMCRVCVDAGTVPSALRLKLAVNAYLITTVAGLAEAFHLGDRLGIERAMLARLLAEGPMASTVSMAKAEKLVAGDFSVQASIVDVHKNCRLVAAAASSSNAMIPLLERSLALFANRERHGDGHLDMAAVIRSFVPSPPSESEAVVARQFDAYQRRHLDAFMACWADDATIRGSDGSIVAQGSAAIRARHQRRFADPALSALLVHRAVAGPLVADEKRVMRTAADGVVEEVDVLGIYEIEDGLILAARFSEGGRGTVSGRAVNGEESMKLGHRSTGSG